MEAAVGILGQDWAEDWPLVRKWGAGGPWKGLWGVEGMGGIRRLSRGLHEGKQGSGCCYGAAGDGRRVGRFRWSAGRGRRVVCALQQQGLAGGGCWRTGCTDGAMLRSTGANVDLG